MTDCGCDKARKDLEEYLRNEVCNTRESDIREHIEHCSACQNEVVIAKTLTEVIQRACRENAPAELKDIILNRIREVQRSHDREVAS